MGASKTMAGDGSFHLIVNQSGYRAHVVLAEDRNLVVIEKGGKILLDTFGSVGEIIEEIVTALCVEDAVEGARMDIEITGEERAQILRDMDKWDIAIRDYYKKENDLASVPWGREKCMRCGANNADSIDSCQFCRRLNLRNSLRGC
jgi:hypothetical protein